MSVSLKLDRDFLHPSDRARLVSTMVDENMTAFVTLSSVPQQTLALQLDGELFRGQRQMGVSSLTRSDARALQNEGEKIVTLAHKMLTLV